MGLAELLAKQEQSGAAPQRRNNRPQQSQPAREWGPQDGRAGAQQSQRNARSQQDARSQQGAAPQKEQQGGRAPEARGRPQQHTRSQQDVRTSGDRPSGDTRSQQDARWQQRQPGGGGRFHPTAQQSPYLFFGDSFVRLFTLVRHHDIKVPAEPRQYCKASITA